MRITLSPYDPGWRDQFVHLERLVRGALGEAARAVEHVGSTAVPGLAAKPVIDVVLEVADAADEPAYAPPLEDAGFVFHLREPEWHQHRLFKREEPACNLHIFPRDCPEVARMLAFRDLLRHDAEARTRYEARKRELAQREWDRVQDYADQKSEVIELLLTRGTENG